MWIIQKCTRRLKIYFIPRKPDVLIGPSEERQNNFLSRKFTSSLSEPQPHSSRTSFTRWRIAPQWASAGGWPRWREGYRRVTDISDRQDWFKEGQRDRVSHTVPWSLAILSGCSTVGGKTKILLDSDSSQQESQHVKSTVCVSKFLCQGQCPMEIKLIRNQGSCHYFYEIRRRKNENVVCCINVFLKIGYLSHSFNHKLRMIIVQV